MAITGNSGSTLPAVASRLSPLNDGQPIKAVAPRVALRWPISWAPYCTGRGEITAPSLLAAKKQTTSSTILGNCTMTRLSAPTPLSSSCPARAVLAASSSAKLSRWDGVPVRPSLSGWSATARASGCRAACWASNPCRVSTPQKPASVRVWMRVGVLLFIMAIWTPGGSTSGKL